MHKSWGLAVFAAAVQVKTGTWDQTTALVMYGLTFILATMILVEQKSSACESS